MDSNLISLSPKKKFQMVDNSHPSPFWECGPDFTSFFDCLNLVMQAKSCFGNAKTPPPFGENFHKNPSYLESSLWLNHGIHISFIPSFRVQSFENLYIEEEKITFWGHQLTSLKFCHNFRHFPSCSQKKRSIVKCAIPGSQLRSVLCAMARSYW